jgi:hypothetical protein
MREAMGRDAKNPVLPFEDDSAMKQRALTGSAREAMELKRAGTPPSRAGTRNLALALSFIRHH